jgi:polar amino acid transport system ATP-binding protein
MIEFRSVHKYYGAYPALVDVTAEVRRGEVVVVCGPSGSGKSTLIRTVKQNVHAPMSSAALNRLRSRIGFVFQSFNLFPHLSALENISMSPVRVNGVSRAMARDKAMQLLDRVGLANKAHAYPAQLSGGQQQRVAIARALAMEPPAMLFDEPSFAAPDPKTREMVGFDVDLCTAIAKRLASTKGSTSELAIKLNGSDPLTFQDTGSVYTVQQNKALGMVANTMTITKLVNESQTNGIKLKMIQEPMVHQPIGVGMKKDEPALLAKINETLLAMDQAGEINQLWDKWLGPNTEFMMVRTDKVVPLKDVQFTPLP